MMSNLKFIDLFLGCGGLLLGLEQAGLRPFFVNELKKERKFKKIYNYFFN